MHKTLSFNTADKKEHLCIQLNKQMVKNLIFLHDCSTAFLSFAYKGNVMKKKFYTLSKASVNSVLFGIQFLWIRWEDFRTTSSALQYRLTTTHRCCTCRARFTIICILIISCLQTPMKKKWNHVAYPFSELAWIQYYSEISVLLSQQYTLNIGTK